MTYVIYRDIETDEYHTPIIAMTADVMSKRCGKFMRPGMDDCITKPFDENDVWGIIIKWLDPEITRLDKSHSVFLTQARRQQNTTWELNVYKTETLSEQEAVK